MKPAPDLLERWLSHEVAIVWEVDVQDLPFVRESWAAPWTRQRPFRWPGRVGYSILAPDAPNAGYPRLFHRRVFWLKPGDLERRIGIPAEAVDPRTVGPGLTGTYPVVT